MEGEKIMDQKDIRNNSVPQGDEAMPANDETAYVNDINRYPFLKDKEEIGLKKEAEAGSVAKILLRIRDADMPVTADDIHKAIESTGDYHIELWESHFDDLEGALVGKTDAGLKETEHEGNRAREKLITGSLRFVIKMTGGYSNSVRSMSQSDIIQEGNIGLINGVEHYDYKMGYSLLTYCSYWIRQRIDRAISEQDRAVRLPVHFDQLVRKIAVYRKGCYERNGRCPDEKTVRKEFDISHDTYVQAMHHMNGITSLDTDISPDGEEGSSLGDFIASSEKTPEEQYVDCSFTEEVMGLLDDEKKYSPREKEIFLYRMGLIGSSDLTLEKIGQMYGITRERVRQIENGVKRKLRKDLIRKYGQKGFNEMQRAACCG